MGFYTLKHFIKKPCLLCGDYSNTNICPCCANELTTNSKRCIGCAITLSNNTELDYCGSCLARPPQFNRVWTLYDYTGFIQRLIHDFKYNQQLSVGKFFAKTMFDFWCKLDNYDAIIPMPLHKKRLQERGFNQVIELLRIIKKQTTIDYKSCVRVKATKQLVNLNLKEREKEVKGAFRIVKTMHYNNILLVDDVLTTSASIRELSKTILQTYPKNKPNIDVLVLARTTKNNGGGHT